MPIWCNRWRRQRELAFRSRFTMKRGGFTMRKWDSIWWFLPAMHRSLFLNVAQEYTEKRDKYLKVSDRHFPKLHQLAVAEEQFLGCGPQPLPSSCLIWLGRIWTTIQIVKVWQQTDCDNGDSRSLTESNWGCKEYISYYILVFNPRCNRGYSWLRSCCSTSGRMPQAFLNACRSKVRHWCRGRKHHGKSIGKEGHIRIFNLGENPW